MKLILPDYIHKLSRARMLKAQHPDYEIFRMGIHAQRGVSCAVAICHMTEEGGIKYSDHHIPKSTGSGGTYLPNLPPQTIRNTSS